MKKVTRQLKINREIRTDKHNYTGLKTIPSLKIAGQWFQDAGFRSGQRVEIQVKKGKLILTALE